MRIVFDSSVLIAAHISRAGVCAQLLEDVLMQHDVFTSNYILDELARKLTEKFSFPKKDVRAILKFLLTAAQSVDPAKLPENVCRDSEDAPILGTAVAARADLLISVDKDLLTLKDFRGITIIRPGEFWTRTSSRT